MFIFNSPEDKTNREIVLAIFDTLSAKEKSITTRRFFTCKQAESKTSDDYMTELRYNAQESELGDITDSLIQYVLICVIKDSRLRERRLMKPELTIDKAIQAGQSAEETKRQTKILDTTYEHRPVEKANSTTITAKRNIKLIFPEVKEIPPKHKITYSHIIIAKLQKKKKCLAFHKTCNNCKKKGHFIIMCRLRKKYLKNRIFIARLIYL